LLSAGKLAQAVDGRHTESRAELVLHLERLTGRTLRTRAEIKDYVREVAAHTATERPSVRRWLQVKKFTLVALLAFSFMQYYMLGVLLEITSMHSTVFFVPARAPVLIKSAIHALG
jgi:hypothetical protein